mmetsp:Transcript_19760/g.41108  ORF Transcript_19760/g.41108 Transcript_19760/m.41108 type:complete len:241 (-) Transcript_19760:109-831(-)
MLVLAAGMPTSAALRAPGSVAAAPVDCPALVRFDREREPPKASDYADAYDHLYNDTGYHNNPQLSHEANVVNWAHAVVPARQRSVLVLGCSHGKGVESLSKLGFNASGVDVATKAIDMAKKLRGNTCGAPICFKQASLTQIPWEKDHFDAGVSADVLEHIAPEDVPTVTAEISRVVRSFLFLQIASFKEMARSGEKAGMENLHLSAFNSDWWKKHFVPHGWRVQCDLSTKMYVNLVLVRP